MEDILDQIKEKLKALWEEIRESSAYNTAMEKYHSLPQAAQKGLIAVGVLCVALILLALPYSFYSSSSDKIAEFERDRQLIRDLFKASRQKDSSGSSGATARQTISSAQQKIGTMRLVPEQIGPIETIPNEAFSGSFSKPPVKEEGVGVKLTKLNLNQVIQAGHLLQSIGPQVKLLGMEMTANADDDHYYDVVYKLMSYSLPVEKEDPKEKDGKKKRRSSRRSKGGDDK